MGRVKSFCALLRQEPRIAAGYVQENHADFSKEQLSEIIFEFIDNVPRTDSEDYIFNDVAEALEDSYYYEED